MDSGSGSMAIGEIIGAAFFIVSVITGCMGIIRPFQSKRITFMRDASFLTGAVALLTWIVYHGKIYWYHGLALIGYYITYVVTVLLSSYNWSAQKEIVSKLASTQNLLNETSRLLGSQGKKGNHSSNQNSSVVVLLSLLTSQTSEVGHSRSWVRFL